MSQRQKNADIDSREVLQDNQVSSEEIDSDSETITEHNDKDLPEDFVQDTRPTRKAMMKARQRLKQWLRSDIDEPSLGSVADDANK